MQFPRVAVDLHRDGDPAVPKDAHRDSRMHVEGDQERGACAPGVMDPDVADSCFAASDSELPVEVPPLVGRAAGSGENEFRVRPGLHEPGPVVSLAFGAQFKRGDADVGQWQDSCRERVLVSR